MSIIDKSKNIDNLMFCGTRSYKNAEHIRQIAAHLIPKESGKGLTSIISADHLASLHTMSNPKDVIENKELADLLTNNMPPLPSASITGALFNGTLHFVQLTFNTPNGTFFVNDQDMQTAINYAKLVVIPISKYASQYGQNSVGVSSNLIKYSVTLNSNEFKEIQLKEWVVDIVNKNHLQTDGSDCIVFMIDRRGPKNLDNHDPPGKITTGFHRSTKGV
jgi:hypothetical protein